MFKVWMLNFLLEYVIFVLGCSLILVCFFSYLYLVPTLLFVAAIFFSFGGVRLLFVKFSRISRVCGFRGVTEPVGMK
jgi:hypothetical protein